MDRLRPLLEIMTHLSKVAFSPHKSSVDNRIINNELMQYMNKKKGKKSYMAMKMNLVKAYDTVE